MANTTAHIAIVGMACRVPGASSVEEFWNNLVAGADCISRNAATPGHVGAKGVLAGADLFDAALFGYTPREAELTDPQHRVMLECAWQALENAGYGMPCGARVGVYAGVAMNTYLLRNLLPHAGLVASEGAHQILAANDKDFVPTRISYELDLTGPSVNVQTACSTSLVAVHMACQSLLAFQCDMALAGGAAVTVPLEGGYAYREGGILSPDGHCRAFDANAQGTVPGDGVGMVVLKRLDDAIEAGDIVHAVILGSAINNDGGRKVGFTAPSVSGQTSVIAEAQALAGVSAATIGYVEAHGTGTPLGDPIEVAALTSAFRRSTPAIGACAIGSVKSNVGHLDTAAGITGLIKAVLAVKHGVIPATLHVSQPNPALQLVRSPFYLPVGAKPFPAGVRRAAVSAFGIGGTNAHAVLEQAPVRQPSGPSRPWAVLPISALTPSALRSASARMASHLEADDVSLADAAFTLSAGRRALGQRRAVVASARHDAAAALRRHADSVTAQIGLRTAFLFPGQGAQRPGTGRMLYEQELVFRAALDDAAQALLSAGTRDIRESLWSAASEIHETAEAQPVLFAIEFALAELWRSWGVEATAVLGHSVGEFAAACVAQVLRLDEAARLVAARGRLMQEMPRGAMLSVPLSPGEVEPFLRNGVWMCAVNGPSSCVLGGETSAIERVEREFTDRGLVCQRLRTSHAFHTPMMDGMLEEFRREAASIPPRAPRVAWASARSGRWMPNEPVDASYWVAQVREPVQFAAAVATLAEGGFALLELGPGATLTSLIRSQRPSVVSVPSLGGDPRNEGRVIAESVAGLWAAGVDIDWPRYYQNEQRHRVELPTYPFERQRYWIDPPAAGDRASSSLLYVPDWQTLEPLPRRTAQTPVATWLLCGDETPLRLALVKRLQAAGASVFVCGLHDDFQTVLASVNPDHVLHLGAAGDSRADAARVISDGYQSLLALGQALGARDMPGTLAIVSSGVHAVHHQDEVCAEKALVLGVARVLPQEHPSIRCRAIDIESGPITDERIDQLLAECLSEQSVAAVAYRGRHRWAPSFVPFEDDSGDRAPRGDGVYLITGGSGAVGRTIARHLASRGARVALVGRTAARAEEDVTFDLDALPAVNSPASFIDVSENGAAVPFPADAASLLDELCTSLAREFIGSGAAPAPEYARFGAFLNVVASAALPARRSDLVCAEAAGRHPSFAPLFELLFHCGSRYRDVLSGNVGALDVLYAGGQSDRIEKAVACMSRYSGHGNLARVVAASLKAAARSGGKRLRVLEIGAGNGFLTREVAPALRGCNVDYHVSDVSRAFVERAQRWAAAEALPSVTTGVLDITLDATAQGWRDPFDVIIGLDVVHATPDLDVTLRNLRRLLVPGGTLQLIETLPPARWNTMVWGLARDWWSYTDLYRTSGPLLSADGWRAALARCAFTDLSAIHADDCALLVAQAPLEVDALLGADVLEITADVTDARGIRNAILTTRKHFGTLHGVIHAAGAELSGAFSSASGEAALSAKVRGTRALLAALADQPLDFLLLCSSVTSLLGGVGNVEYTAANAFLDAVAHERGSRPFPIVSVNWDRWQGLGMAATVEARHRERTGETLAGGLPADRALACFDRITAQPRLPQFVVSAEPFERMRHAASAVTVVELADRIISSGSHQRPFLPTEFVAPRTDTEQRIAAVWQETLGVDLIGVDDEFAALGGDSLIALKVVSRLREALGVHLRVGTLFDEPTIARLAAHVSNVEEGSL
jgi:acyl transferase domain-containing protein/acyl carrier protein